MSEPSLASILEAVLLAADKPLNVEQLQAVFDELQRPSSADVQQAIVEIQNLYAERTMELKEVASGWRMQVREIYAPWVGRLSEERPSKYSRAFLETLALVAYRQPVTRGEIEEVRGVAVNSHIIRTLQEREWIRVVGHREVPGRPALFGTTRKFLDYFNMKSLAELPALMPVRDLDAIEAELSARSHHLLDVDMPDDAAEQEPLA